MEVGVLYLVRRHTVGRVREGLEVWVVRRFDINGFAFTLTLAIAFGDRPRRFGLVVFTFAFAISLVGRFLPVQFHLLQTSYNLLVHDVGVYLHLVPFQ